MSTKYTLYFFSSCPYCTRVRLFIKTQGIDVKQKNIRKNTKYKQQLIAGGGKAQVPCLCIKQNGKKQWLYESRDIINYLKANALHAKKPPGRI